MADEISIDRNTLRALGADTRINILKKLAGDRRRTQAELASELSLSQPAIKEHLESLLGAGLVERIESEHKWKYYQITEKGRAIIEPTSKKIWFILGISVCALIASFASLGNWFSPRTMAINIENSAPSLTGAAPMALEAGATAMQKTADAAQTVSSGLPPTEFFVIVIALIAIGACLAIIITKKNRIE